MSLLVIVACVLSFHTFTGTARGAGLLDGISADDELIYSLISTKTHDRSTATTTKTEVNTFSSRSNVRLNYDIFPKLNLNAGSTYEKNLSEVSGDGPNTDTELTRLRPYVWLTLRDPLFTAAIGYDLRDDSAKTSGQPETKLLRETYSANAIWRPADLPWTQVRYTRAKTWDEPTVSVDTTEDLLFLKTEYLRDGLDVYYAGNWEKTDDSLRKRESSQTSHEGRFLYSTTGLLDGRLSVTTDNHVRYTQFENVTELPLLSIGGLSGLSDTPLLGALTANPALVDANLTGPSDINLGFPAGGPTTPRNIGLDFAVPGEVGTLDVWVDGWGPTTLPADITNFFSWDIYTSSDNQTWAFHTTVTAAPFGPFDRRFRINFPTVTTRYIKAVTRPLPGTVIGSTNTSQFPNIFVTEVQAFVSRNAGETRTASGQLVQNYTLDVKFILFRAPLLYYNFNGQYFETERETRYTISNGLHLSHRINPIFSTTANASFEIGTERDEIRKAVLYYASLTATPLPTLTDSLVVSGNQEWVGDARSTTNSVVLYNTAQLYRGIDTTLNLGAVFTSDEQDGVETRRRDLFVNVGAGVTPNPRLTLTGYYLGKLSHFSGGTGAGARDIVEHRLDLAMSFVPFRTLAISAGANIFAQTGRDTTILQNYALSWAPFPDGNLQFNVYYTENYQPEHSRIVQPSVRWYLTSRRRSYLEATYQFSTSESGSVDTETRLFSTALRVFF